MVIVAENEDQTAHAFAHDLCNTIDILIILK